MSRALGSCNATASTGEHHVCEQSANHLAETPLSITAAVLHVTPQTRRAERERGDNAELWPCGSGAGGSTCRYQCFSII